MAAKQIATISLLYGGRMAVNVVSGWFRGEFAAIGEHWLDHDERYRRSEEFIRALRGIWTEDNFTFPGDFYRYTNYNLQAEAVPGLRRSSRAVQLARCSRYGFAGFRLVLHQRQHARGNQQAGFDDIRAKAAANGQSVRVGVNAFAIARDTEAEAKQVLAEIIETPIPKRLTPSATRSRMPARPRRKARATGRSPPSRISSSTTTASVRT